MTRFVVENRPTGCCVQRGTELGGVSGQGGGRLWWSPGQGTGSVMVVRMERSGGVTGRGAGALVGYGRQGGGSHQGRIRVSGLGNRIDGFIMKLRKREIADPGMKIRDSLFDTWSLKCLSHVQVGQSRWQE